MGRFEPLRYEIRVEGHVDASYSAWLGDLRLRHDFHHDQAITVLSGPVADQAALHGVLDKLQAMGMILLNLTRIEP